MWVGCVAGRLDVAHGPRVLLWIRSAHWSYALVGQGSERYTPIANARNHSLMTRFEAERQRKPGGVLSYYKLCAHLAQQ
jgi:hypothetical protein